MGTHASSESKTSDTDTRTDTKTPPPARPNDTAITSSPVAADSTTESAERSQLVALEADAPDDELDTIVAAVTTIAQSWCERATDYADIETLVCHLPIDQYSFAAHDTSAPYSGPYPMAILVRTFLIETLNGWDETALHDYLYANPSLRRDLGFETLSTQSTF
jgi:putative transposase